MSMFTAVTMAPRDPILGLNEEFATSQHPHKVNLGVGVYFDDNGKLPLLQCVQEAEKKLMSTPAARGYLPIDGIVAYDNAVKSLVFGAESEPVKLKAATEILDRAGVRAGFDIDTNINIDVRPAASIIAERLARLTEGAKAVEQILTPQEDVVDAEVVEEKSDEADS